MLEMKCSRTIAAPPERVFEIVTDLRNAPTRVKAITKLEVLTPGPIRKGTRFRETRTLFGRDATEEMEVTVLDPPRSFVRETTNHGCHYTSEFRLTPRGADTDLEFIFRARPLSFVAKAMGLLMRPLGKKLIAVCAKDLDDLARTAEGRS